MSGIKLTLAWHSLCTSAKPMLNRALDLVKIGVSGLVSKGRFQSAISHLTTSAKPGT